MLNNSPMKFNVPGKLVVPRINRNNEVENTGYMLNELMKAKVNRLRLSVRSYINPTEQNKPLELSSPAVDVVGISGLVVTLGLFYERAHQCLSRG